MDEEYQTITLTIMVPIGDYCWNMNNKAICSSLAMSGGNPKCDHRLDYHLEYGDNGGVLKPEKCKTLCDGKDVFIEGGKEDLSVMETKT